LRASADSLTKYTILLKNILCNVRKTSCAKNWQWLLSVRHSNIYSDVRLLRENRDVAIVRVRKDVRLLRENRDVAIVRVRKDVRLLRENRDVGIVRVRKDVTLLRENRDVAIVRVSKDVRY